MMALHQLWDRLRRVRLLSFVARGPAATGWNGNGNGTVEVREVGDRVMTWHEEGLWRPVNGERNIRFTNVYRWTLADDLLRLEHLRLGAANPVYLLDLTQCGDREWRPVSPHLCRDDCYSTVLLVRDDCIVLRWLIDGPRKQGTIEYTYYPDQEEQHTVSTATSSHTEGSPTR
jgi:hypothetical protein